MNLQILLLWLSYLLFQVANFQCQFYLTYQNVNGSMRVDPLVETKVGLIRGLKATDGDYSMFMGIPFGKVDEANPFGVSTPFPPFEDVFEAYDDSAMCPQVEELNNTFVGSLDCLRLNIYVPESAHSQNPLPVLVWIYGGSFRQGSPGRTIYGPKYLVRHDIILVTLNYRLGPYGFMCLNIPEVPGNQGLKDQMLGMRWIKNNIEAFGGDANRITIFGESAGGRSVDLHLYSPQARHFNAAILQSGTSLMPRMQIAPDDTIPFVFAEKLDFTTSDIREALSFLSTVDPKLLIDASSDIILYPCVENDFENVEKFVAEHPINSIPKVKDMPILIGFNSYEWIGKYHNQNNEFFENFSFGDNIALAFDFEEVYSVEMEDIVRKFYIGDENLSDELKLNISAFDSDLWFTYSTARSLDRYIANEADKVFYYIFSYVGERNWVRRRMNITIGGAAHADEIGYLFDVSLWKDTPTPEDQLIIDRMTTMWANFAKYGDPTPETNEVLPVKWHPIADKTSSHYYLNIDSEMTIGRRPYHKRTAFWELFFQINKEFEKGYKED